MSLSIKSELDSLTSFQKVIVVLIVSGAISFFWYWRRDVEYKRCYDVAKSVNSFNEQEVEMFRESKCGNILKDELL